MGQLRFEEIKLTGFKSFVEPTSFKIRDGLTGIVGPNGCGKSNLLEAIRWVMGANSAKAMRAGAMDDVIFSGTSNRPGRGQADVVLTIDNSARIAPPMFNDSDELEVQRLIKKGGGSTYKVNGKTVRAKDVQLLFADASTGANSPALVRQGQINELISAKPENRRRILEEAAGISGLHSRRHEAELRLRAAENNLDRLDDILQQIEAQLVSLRRQSRQASRFKRLAGEIREYKALLWLKRWDAALQSLTEAQQTRGDIETQVQDLTRAAAEKTRIAAQISTTVEPKREAQIIAAAVVARLNAAKEALQSDETAARAEIEKLSGQIKDLAADIGREQGIIDDATEALAMLAVEKNLLSASGDRSADIASAKDTAEKAAAARSQVERDYSDLTGRAASFKARKETAGRDLQEAENRLFRLTRERGEWAEKLATLKSNSGGNANLFEAAVEDHANALTKARDVEAHSNEARQEAEKTERAAREILAQARDVVSKLRAEEKALSDMLSRGRGEAVWTPVLDDIDVRAGYEKALVAAFGDDLSAALGGDAPLRWMGANTPDAALPAGVESLAGYVKAPDALLPRLSQIGLIASDESHLSTLLAPGQCLVTLEGDLWRWDGFAASGDVPSPAAIKLEQQNRLAVLAGDIAEKDKLLTRAQEATEAARAKRDSAEHDAREARRALPDLERAERAAQAALASFKTDVARENAQAQAAQDRLERLDLDVRETTKRRDDLQTFASSVTSDIDYDAELEALSTRLAEARETASEASGTYRQLSGEAASRETRLAAITKELADWTRRNEQARQRVATLALRKDAAVATYTAATTGPDQFAQRRDTLFAELDAAETRRKEANDALAETEGGLRAAEAEARAAESALGKAREDRAAAEARLTAAQERKTEITARIGESLNCEPGELKEQLGDIDPDIKLMEADIERKVERLSRERENMGAVNLRADEEAQEQETRMIAMSDERADLIAAIARLREGIDELNTEGRQRLLAAFDVVNSHFGRLFTTLFGGGHASLALTESDDPLEAGLEVMVSPPGKKLGSMSLMSGGEQALTATALIFAVFMSNPAPICVLDEVDAPLDDANVDRYCNLLDEMSRVTDTRFITITHNPVTMARMDRLFGVTMAEKGVSTMISVDLSSAELMVAAQ
ncbi:AAA family ATPase [Robiginitomaculum antarcticum]|uniref:AAA family ATPase n=1 Tax=Robiginitomaculum antarcticum TaxID=437507 RepID=UPI00036B7619|nr:AAA family ATPase [Robiginitomaculum antarcticum]